MVDRLTPPALDWTEDGAPVSATYGDVYFSREDGLSESRAVFLHGAGLPDAWAGRRCFTVAELGFGTGLNILALLDLWRREKPPGGHLSIWSIEAHPLSRHEAERAHAAWPELTDLSRMLLAKWPERTPGLHRLSLPELDATLDLAFGEAPQMLEAWSGPADAWFLDGFAPAANPGMWSDEVLALVAARSAPGARVATFTVAGQVRRGLAAAGFTVDKRPGHGRKRERLEAVLPGLRADAPALRRIAVIGGGIAGASVVRALRRLGLEPTLIEAQHPGAGASGAPAALVTPRFDGSGGPRAELAALAFQRATDLYLSETPGAVLDRGVLRVPKDTKDMNRLLAAADLPIWRAGVLARRGPAEVAALTGEADAPASLWMEDALVVEPAAILDAWLADGERVTGHVAALTPGITPRITFEDGRSLAFDAIVLAAGWGSQSLGLSQLRPLRGQLAFVSGVSPGCPAVWGPGYAIPTRDGFLFGATHDRGQTHTDPDSADTDRLLDQLTRVRPGLAAQVTQAAVTPRAAVRATTPDHHPLCGPVAEGIWTLTGLGGRGFAWAPILAEHLVASLTVTPSPLSRAYLPYLDPGRFSGPD